MKMQNKLKICSAAILLATGVATAEENTSGRTVGEDVSLTKPVARPVARVDTITGQRENNAGFVLAKKGQYAAAEPHFKRALELNPNNPFALTNMAYLYELTGRLSESKAMYQKVVDLRLPANVKPTEEAGGSIPSVMDSTESLTAIANRHLASMTFVTPTTLAAVQ